MASKRIQVSFEEEMYFFDGNPTLAEIAHKLCSSDEEERLIRFSTLMNGQLIVIGDDACLLSMRESIEGDIRLLAKIRQSGSTSSRSRSLRSKTSSEKSMSERSFANQSLTSPATNTLRYRAGYNSVLYEESFIRLKKSLSEMSLFEVGQYIVEAQGLPPLSFCCYLYNKCGWPLAANIEQMQLISGDAYLVNGDFVFGIIWEERPPKPITYIDPDYGQFEYCFDYNNYTTFIRITPNDQILDIRMKLLWKIRVPLDSISVISKKSAINDEYRVTQIDIETKTLKFDFKCLAEYFSKVSDICSAYSGRETRKLYGYLFLLREHEFAKAALKTAAYLLSQRLNSFIYAFHMVLSKNSLTKSERIALQFGCQIMHRHFVSFVTSNQYQDISLMFGLLHHIASVKKTELSALITVTECTVGEADQAKYNISDDPWKGAYIIQTLLYSHMSTQLISFSIGSETLVDYLTAAGSRPPLSFTVLKEYLRSSTFLLVLHPRDISNGTTDRLTYHTNGDLWVNKGFIMRGCDDISYDPDVMLEDHLTLESLIIKKERLVSAVLNFLPDWQYGDVLNFQPDLQYGEMVTREPQEAIVVIFDTSRSMMHKYRKEDTHTRLDAAKIFFILFAQKTMAYDYPHVFSLCTFSTTSSFHFDFTENMESFLKLIQNLQIGSGTALYSTMEQGIVKLQAIKVSHPKILPRMMIISDGEDNRSTVSAKVISDKINEHSITVDVFAVGGNCASLKMISKRSGGYCYYTDTIIDGVRTFESETILKVALRQPISNPSFAIDSEKEFRRQAKLLPFDTEPPRILNPVDIDSKVCSYTRAFELQEMNSGDNPLIAKRVLRELAKYNRDPHPDFALFPLSKNLFVWRGLVEGPPSTPYEGGIFDFYMSFGEGYPGKAPEMRFLTPISHPNITRNGKICHPIFNTSYNTETSVRDILNSVYSLLMIQDFDDYVVSNLSITLSFNKEQFREKATDWTHRYALRTKSKEQLIKEMMIEDDCPEKYKCALSKCLMRNPVYSPKSDKIFERSQIEAHILNTGQDPFTNSSLQIEELIPDLRLQKEINFLYPI